MSTNRKFSLLLFLSLSLGLNLFLSAQEDKIMAAQHEELLTEHILLRQNLARYTATWDQILNERYLDGFNTLNFTEDVVALAGGQQIAGLDAVKAYYGQYLSGFSDIEFSIVDAFGQGEKLVKHWRFRGTHSGELFGIPPTGRAVDIEGVTLVRMRNGRIAQEQDFMDNAVFLQQLGLASDPQNVAVVDGIYQAFSTGDIPAVLGALAPGVIWNEAEGNALADGNPYVGPDAVLQGVFMRLGAEHEYFRVKDIQLHSMDNNQVLATLRYDAQRKDTGTRIDAQAAHLWTLRDGRVVAFQQYVDTRQLAAAAIGKK